MSHDFEVDDQNVEQPQHDDASWATAVVAESSSSNRVWRACLECRKKKVRQISKLFYFGHKIRPGKHHSADSWAEKM